MSRGSFTLHDLIKIASENILALEHRIGFLESTIKETLIILVNQNKKIEQLQNKEKTS